MQDLRASSRKGGRENKRMGGGIEGKAGKRREEGRER